MHFGSILKSLRLRAGYTQQMLAERLGVTKSVVSFYERQERGPSPDVLIKLSSVFHVSTDYLLGIEPSNTLLLNVEGLAEEDIQLISSLTARLRQKKKDVQKVSLIS